MAFQIYKSGQGRYVRVGTAIGAGLVALVLAYYVYVLLDRHIANDFPYKIYVEWAGAALFFAGVAIAAAVYINKPEVVDFLIATESEMKKVSWSSRAELLGSTVVVIVTVFLLALLIWLADTSIVLALTRGLGLW